MWAEIDSRDWRADVKRSVRTFMGWADHPGGRDEPYRDEHGRTSETVRRMDMSHETFRKTRDRCIKEGWITVGEVTWRHAKHKTVRRRLRVARQWRWRPTEQHRKAKLQEWRARYGRVHRPDGRRRRKKVGSHSQAPPVQAQRDVTVCSAPQPHSPNSGAPTRPGAHRARQDTRAREQFGPTLDDMADLLEPLAAMLGLTVTQAANRLRWNANRLHGPRCRTCDREPTLDKTGRPYPQCYICAIGQPRCLTCGGDVHLDARGLPWPRCRTCQFDDDDSADTDPWTAMEAAWGPRETWVDYHPQPSTTGRDVTPTVTSLAAPF